MNKTTSLCFLLVLSGGVLSSCGGKPNPCSKVCAYVNDCWGEDGFTECRETCPTLVQEVEEEGYDAGKIADCIVEEASCWDLLSIESVIEECKVKISPDAATDAEPDPVMDPRFDRTPDAPADEPADPRLDPAAEEAGDLAGEEAASISAQEACVTIGHAYCDRRDDCLGEHPPDIRDCRDGVDLECESRTGVVSRDETSLCESAIAYGDCADLFDAAGDPVPQPDCPGVYP
jgi:hypothetical protein